ncbi:MAG: hypothetical protein J7J06_04545 [Methanosarcinales archaeon]|nr:hypothetical protein [Methanosarcinales archaeon]
MYRFMDSFSELGRFFGRLNTYYALLDAILVFVLSYAIAIVTGIHHIGADMIQADIIRFSDIGKEIAAPALCAIVFAAAITLLVSAAIAMFARQRDPDRVCAAIGAAYPELEEPLAAARDNCGVENIMVNDLADDVAKKMDEIEYSSLLDQKRLTSRVILIVVFAFIITSFAVADFSLIGQGSDLKLPIIRGSGGGGSGNDGSGGMGAGGDSMSTDAESADRRDDIYGEPSVASITGTNLDLKMYPGVGSEFSIRETSETGMHDFEESSQFPVEPVASETSDERIEDADLVARYFEELHAAG